MSLDGGPDRLVFDRAGADRLLGAIGATVGLLGHDRVAVAVLVDEAVGVLHRDLSVPILELRRAHEGLDQLGADLRRRLDLVDARARHVAAIEQLGSDIRSWPGSDNDPEFDRLVAARRDAVLTLLGGDRALTLAVLRHIDAGHGAVDAIDLARADARAARVDDVVAALGLDRVAAARRVDEIDAGLARVLRAGHPFEVAAVVVSMALSLDLDLGEALVTAARRHTDPVQALGWMATARGLGVTTAELLALEGLVRHFAAFDVATGSRPDDRVSEDDLLQVVTRPAEFTPAQVTAAEAILAHPALRNRLDTAHDNTEVVGGERFGGPRPGDRIISLDDIESFMLKARLNVALQPYADEIDVAADPSGRPDGFYSRADFERFIATGADVADHARDAARTILDAEWYDRTWFEKHRDEIAVGMAVLGGGTVIVLSGGAATPAVVATAALTGAGSAGVTTIAINLTGDAEDPFAGVVGNGFDGAVVGFSLAGLPTSVAALRSTSGLARGMAAAGATSDVSGVVAAGGFDVLVADDYEDALHGVAGGISQASGLTSLGYSVVRAGRAWITDPRSLEEQIQALTAQVSRQKQERHLAGATRWTHEQGGYVTSLDEAQEVLDAVRDGRAEILGRSRNGGILARYDGVTGFDNNRRHLRFNVPTNTFIVKGERHPSVVPTNPEKRPLP